MSVTTEEEITKDSPYDHPKVLRDKEMLNDGMIGSVNGGIW